jgi:putative N6-adenine-specific DNA methylase
LGLPVRTESVAGVETEGTMEEAMRLNLFLRTGQRVLFFLRKLEAKNADDLYAGISRIEWEDFISPEEYLCVTSAVDNPTIRDFRFANLKCKDAIVDRIKKKTGRRPDSGSERTGAVVDLYWKENLCLVYLDTSGEPLYRRGYRKIPLHAPMQETLAAAVIQATGWRGRGNFVNPMCGSGTLAIEAALSGLDMAPGLLRKNFGFMHLKGFNRASWNKMLQEARARVKKSFRGKFVATDIDPQAIHTARQHAAAAGIGHLIEFSAGDYSETPIPEGSGVVILNPEYGERMGQIEQLKGVYRGIGDFFKKKCQGYTGYIFTGNLDLAKKVGLKPKRRTPFFNSNIECRLLEYDLYEGSREISGAEP